MSNEEKIDSLRDRLDVLNHRMYTIETEVKLSNVNINNLKESIDTINAWYEEEKIKGNKLLSNAGILIMTAIITTTVTTLIGLILPTIV